MNQIKEEKVKVEPLKIELSDSWWYRVYIAVVVFTVFVISALAIFSQHFS